MRMGSATRTQGIIGNLFTGRRQRLSLLVVVTVVVLISLVKLSEKGDAPTTVVRVQVDDSLLRSATIAIKTFERPDMVLRLVRGLRDFHPSVRVIVLDDSLTPKSKEDLTSLGIEYVTTSFDMGLAHGRNQLLDLVSTPYVVFLDDDYEFSTNTRISVLLHVLKTSDVDIAGGLVGDRLHTYPGFKLIRKGHFLYQADGDYGSEQGCRVVDIVPNFFAARTERLRLVRWDDTFKLGEHEDFFLRAKGVLKTVCCPQVVIGHASSERWLRDSSSKLSAYDRMRRRALRFQQVFLRKHRLSWYISHKHSALAKLRSPLSLASEGVQRVPHGENVHESIFLVWVADPNAFQARNKLALESIFFHHPDAKITVYSNTLPLTFFQDLVGTGFHIEIQRFNLRTLCPSCPGSVWVNQLDEWKKGPHFLDHVSIFLRLTLLYRGGGTFIAFDHVVLRPLYDISKGIGAEECDQEWCIPMEHLGESSRRFELNSNLMVAFAPLAPLLGECLQEFGEHYDPTWKNPGALLLTRTYNKAMGDVHAVYPFAFYPVPRSKAQHVLKQMDEELQRGIDGQSFACSLRDSLTHDVPVASGSLIESILLRNCVLCGETSDDTGEESWTSSSSTTNSKSWLASLF